MVVAVGPLGNYRAAMAAASRRLAAPDVEVSDLSGARGALLYARYGAGPPVLVLHGSGGGWDQGLDWARRRLAPGGDAGFDVVSPSRFGYPGSTLPDAATVADQVAALVELLDHLGLDRANVVGLSAGSAAALQLAADHPGRVHRLVLESPLLPLTERAPLPPRLAVRVLARAQLILWLTTRVPAVVRLAAGAAPGELPPDDRQELAAVNATMFPLRSRREGTVFDRAVTAPHLLADRVPVAQITAPTLIINAAHAALAPHEATVRFTARLPAARLLEIEHGGHVLIGNVQRLRHVVTTFLTE